MKKTTKSLIGWIIYIAILAGLIYAIPQALAYALKTNYPIAAITSGSMWPVLKTGDIVLIEGVQDKSQIKVGDIVVYKNPLGFTIHRIIEINGDTIITKGDANNVSDTPIKFPSIIGKTVVINQKPLRIPFLGDINILLSKK